MEAGLFRGQIADALAGRPIPDDADTLARDARQLADEGRAARAVANLFFERLTEMWHDGDSELTLAEFVGFDGFAGYAAFIEGRWTDAAHAIEATT